jgi:hypothetical protein
MECVVRGDVLCNLFPACPTQVLHNELVLPCKRPFEKTWSEHLAFCKRVLRYADTSSSLGRLRYQKSYLGMLHTHYMIIDEWFENSDSDSSTIPVLELGVPTDRTC